MDFDAAFDRIKRATGSTSQAQVAKVLELRQGAVSDAKRRRVIPKPWLFKLESKYKLAPEWVLTGEGPQFILSDGTPVESPLQGLPPSRQAELDLREFENALRLDQVPGYQRPTQEQQDAAFQMLREVLRQERAKPANIAPVVNAVLSSYVLSHVPSRAAVRHLIKLFAYIGLLETFH